MIAISGVFLLVACVLLVVALFGTGFVFVYASIAASLAALLALGIGIRQWRADKPAPGPDGPVRAVPVRMDKQGAATEENEEPVSRQQPGPAQRRVAPTSRAEAEPPLEDDDELSMDVDFLDDDEYAGLVLVVPGHPRYHVDGCRYLQGVESVELDVVDARKEGFSPCSSCRPDLMLAVELADAPHDLDTSDALVHQPDAVVDQPDVVVSPEQGSFHRAECREVREEAGTQILGRDEAMRHGYDACEVCRP